PRIRLTAPVRNAVGLELVAFDVDRDRRADLILVSASSVEPIAVWLNKGDGAFERSSASFAPLFGDTDSPHIQRAIARNDAQGALFTDDSPDAFEFAEEFVFRLEGSLLARYADHRPLPLSVRGPASTRGPPSVL